MIKMVRTPSETPNITNIDDIVPFRYAYGNNDGFVKGKGNELSYTIDGPKFRINSGRVVLHGVESEIDANGVSIQIDTINETRYYSVYYNVNLATNTTSILSTYDTAGYPVVDKGEDLTTNSSGYANLELYRFTATNGVINEVSKVVKEIPYPMTGYDITKGTVEERLTRLGFREGVTTFSSDALTWIDESKSYIKFYRQGNYVIIKGKVGFSSPTGVQYFFTMTSGDVPLFTIPSEFLPLEPFNFFIGGSLDVVQPTAQYGGATLVRYALSTLCKASLDGLVTNSNVGDLGGVPTDQNYDGAVTIDLYSVEFSVGYEAVPIE